MDFYVKSFIVASMCHDALTLPVALCTATGLISMLLCVPLLHVCDTYLTAISLYKRAAIVAIT